MSLKQDFKNEFSSNKILFSGGKAQDFFNSRFCTGIPLPLAIYRLTCFLYTTTVLIIVLATDDEGMWNYAYFTIWTYTTILLYFFFATIVSVSALHLVGAVVEDIESFQHIYRRRKTGREVQPISKGANGEEGPVEASQNSGDDTPSVRKSLPPHMKLQWTLYSIALPSSIIVTSVYWPFALIDEEEEVELGFIGVSVHVVNLLTMLLEQYLSSIPSRILHVYQPIVYGFTYVGFNAIIWYAADVVPYSVIDWGEDPGLAAGIAIVVTVYYICIQPILFLISRSLAEHLKNAEDGK